ncbi:MAG TPA: 16S rRNA (uracil(1498)-N(3))-methyltransferase [Propionicimonas sp.]|nr:16S rRNA (uracil(1498)-N(3))-methyltransferase [Propionicimonas sp.]HQA77712.1 16S rRNA (uracil(1498)-N(3))-methyltransferase [Propionicimonas sp.]
MTEPLFLALLDAPEVGQTVTLGGDEGRHAATVKRIRVGEVVLISDGNGAAVRGPVLTVDKSQLTVRVEAVLHEQRPTVKYVAVQALPKGDRAEQAVEMLTELGVDEIVPWQAERSVVRWAADRVERGLTRWRATAREAAKQSRRFRVPTVSVPMTTGELVQRIAQTDLTVVLHESADAPLAALELPAEGEIMFIVGPEGGLTDAEVAAFTQAGARAALVADAVLRTGTAGVVALAQLHALAQRHELARHELAQPHVALPDSAATSA